MRTYPLTAVALAMFAMLGAAQAQQSPTELNKVTVTGEGDKLGTGLLMDEDAPKARSSVTKAQLEKTRSSGNPFQALTLLPGVNSSSYDATGLFGGSLRVRGFNSDQMGFTVNGAPVNDSGNFAVFPQEYIDQENLCSLYVTQGAPDTDAPHVGASGGNVGIYSCAPESTQRTRISISGGQLGFYRLYGRVDTGKVGDFKGFVSISKSQADKWKGPGKADRDHLDAGADYDLGSSNKISTSLLYNRSFTNNFRALPYASANPNTATLSNGKLSYFDDFTATIPQHLTPVNGTAQNEASIASGLAYAGYSLNPFENALWSAKGSFALSERLRVDVIPYFWYGYGTGGTQQTSLAESSTGLHGGIADINGDGDRLDTVMIYRGSLTQTFRPGMTASFTYTLDSQKINAGFWFERARHLQTQPGVNVDNAGGIGDPWLDGNLLKYNDGATYQGRNWRTISTGESVFIQDQIDLLDNKLQITPAFSYRRLKRDFTNYANSGTGGAADYQVTDTYGKPLPSLALSLQATQRIQVFSSVARNFRTPSNFEFGNLGRGTVTYDANGVGTYSLPLGNLGVKPETSTNFDLGTRYKGDMFTGSVTAFYNKFKNRISSSTDPVTLSVTDTNVGDSTTKGLEVEAGTVPINGFSAYVSGSYTKSTIDSNVITHYYNPSTGAACTAVSPACVTGVYQTAGNIFPDTPKGMASMSVQWAQGPYLVNLAAKYTSARFLTLMNDAQLKSFVTVDLNTAWKLPDLPGNGFKNPIIRLNVTNLLNRKYYNANSGSGSNAGVDIVSSTPAVYPAAPRFTSVTFQVDY